jgi:hypothetical protein
MRSQGFNLIGVSQFQQLPGNAVDFFLRSSSITVLSSGNKRQFRIPLVLDDGLFALDVELFQLDNSLCLNVMSRREVISF